MGKLLIDRNKSRDDLYKPHIKEVNAPISKTRSSSAQSSKTRSSINLDKRLAYDPIARRERYERLCKKRGLIAGKPRKRKRGECCEENI